MLRTNQSALDVDRRPDLRQRRIVPKTVFERVHDEITREVTAAFEPSAADIRASAIRSLEDEGADLTQTHPITAELLIRYRIKDVLRDVNDNSRRLRRLPGRPQDVIATLIYHAAFLLFPYEGRKKKAAQGMAAKFLGVTEYCIEHAGRRYKDIVRRSGQGSELDALNSIFATDALTEIGARLRVIDEDARREKSDKQIRHNRDIEAAISARPLRA